MKTLHDFKVRWDGLAQLHRPLGHPSSHVRTGTLAGKRVEVHVTSYGYKSWQVTSYFDGKIVDNSEVIQDVDGGARGALGKAVQMLKSRARWEGA